MMTLHEASAEDAFRPAGRTSCGSDHHEVEPAIKAAFLDAARSHDSTAINYSPSDQISEGHAGNRTENGCNDKLSSPNVSSPNLNVEDRLSFPTLSTAALHSALPKWKRAERGALRSLVLSEADKASTTNVISLPKVSPSATKWPTDASTSIRVDKESARLSGGSTDLEEALPVASEFEKEISRVASDDGISMKASAGKSHITQDPETGCYGTKSSSQPLDTTMDQAPGVHQHHAIKLEDVEHLDITQLTAQSMKPAEQVFANVLDSAKKSLNVDSPSFTPAQLQLGGKKSTFSSLANAAPFTPKGVSNSSTPAVSQDTDSPFLNPATVREFTPQSQNYDLNTASATNGMAGESGSGLYDAYTMASISQALPTSQYNPYAEEHNSMAAAGAPYYPTQGVYAASIQPLQYHLYAPVGINRNDLTPYQRQPQDFFISNDLREELQKKSAAARQVLPDSRLPDVQPYHSLVPLEGPKNGQSSIFGNTVCWVYKATSKNGHVYCLRRLQGVRVASKDSTNGPLNKWKRINNGGVVTPVTVFTSRDFNDTSLIFIHNYHPVSKTLAEVHLSGGRFKVSIQESLLWSYITQLCNALRSIHTENLAARCIHPTKIILTEKNRIRLSACMILDVLEFDAPRPLAELQYEDLVDLGKLILSLGLNQSQIHNIQASWEAFQRTAYSAELMALVRWLIFDPDTEEAKQQKNIGYLSQSIAHHLFDSFDASLHAYDDLNSEIHKELENGRVARLLLKLGTINERPEFDNDPNWSENGERYTLKLFRDYVFHQVDANNNPVLNLGHMLSCLNKLDAGIDEKVYLTSRDHQTAFVVSYKELKKQIANAFQELQKGAQAKSAAPRNNY